MFLATALPIGFNNISIKRTLPTECVSIFTPFDRLNTLHSGGFFYSLHADTRQAIVLNHDRLKAGNGFILGSSGSGKGMTMKPLVLNILFNTDDDVILVDPENENKRFVEALGGQSIELSHVSKDYINPFDIPLEDEDFQSGTHPTTLKLDLILSIIEAMIGTEVNPAIISTVDGVLTEIYKAFQSSRDPKDLPTFKEFYEVMTQEETIVAKELSEVLKIYVTGSWSNFSNQTNVDIESRLMCYNTSKLGEHLKAVGSFLMFDAIWNRIAKNRNSNKNT
ncbi:MAG: ATP-binding protein [Defluviitaleaceae bacterium]|nr:ATP-binding protein [Defluviitaleaceae bacterium]